MRTKPPKVKFSELCTPISVVLCESRPAWQAAAVGLGSFLFGLYGPKRN